MLTVRIRKDEEIKREKVAKATSEGFEGGETVSSAAPASAPKKADGTKVGRNDPCPCGSGKKYKNCCGRN